MACGNSDFQLQKAAFLDIGEGCVRDLRLIIDAAGALRHREWTPTLNPDKRLNHGESVELASKCRLLGGAWSLPEDPAVLLTLVDYDRFDPATYAGIQDVKADWHWTAKQLASSSDLAWGVYLGHGHVHYDHRCCTGFVRACRLVPASQ